jgi:hypothetical protein
MAHTELSLNHITSAGLADPSGTTGVVGGFKFQNDGTSFLRIVNSPTTHSAVCTISLGAATPAGGTYTLKVTIFGKHYTTAAIAYGALKAVIATDVLAATEDVTGNTLSTDYPAATCVGGGTDLPTGPVTLTFGGAGVTGLATTPLVVTIDCTSVTGGSYSTAMTTPGVGVGQLTVEVPSGSQGKNLVVPIPTGTTWFGAFSTSLYNQPLGSTDPGEIYVDFDAQYANYTVSAFHPT